MTTIREPMNAILRFPGEARGHRTSEPDAWRTLELRGYVKADTIRRTVHRNHTETLVTEWVNFTTGEVARLRVTYSI